MKARDYFEGIRVWVVEMAKIEATIELVETQAGPHGQSVGGGSGRDHMGGIDRLVDTGLREMLASIRRVVNPRIEQASEVLYGRSGNGGLAKAKSTIDADILCGYYLQGLEWPQVAAQHSGFSASKPNIWCRMRAKRALEYIDKVGADSLADS